MLRSKGANISLIGLTSIIIRLNKSAFRFFYVIVMNLTFKNSFLQPLFLELSLFKFEWLFLMVKIPKNRWKLRFISKKLPNMTNKSVNFWNKILINSMQKLVWVRLWPFTIQLFLVNMVNMMDMVIRNISSR